MAKKPTTTRAAVVSAIIDNADLTEIFETAHIDPTEGRATLDKILASVTSKPHKSGDSKTLRMNLNIFNSVIRPVLEGGPATASQIAATAEGVPVNPETGKPSIQKVNSVMRAALAHGLVSMLTPNDAADFKAAHGIKDRACVVYQLAK